MLLTRSYKIGIVLRQSCCRQFSNVNVLQRSRQLPKWLGTVIRRQASSSNGNGERKVGYWLLACCGMVSGSVIIGGLTRLTESGLSMVNWHLLKDMRPPRTQQEWEAEFEKYKQYPEYEHVHKEMTLDQYRTIYYMEYLHRMWGRAIGLVFAIPATYFFMRGSLSRPLKIRTLIYGGLIGFQGFLGWWMVKSGLKFEAKHEADIPRVSQYRLAAHFGMAILLYSSMLYTALGILLPVQPQPAHPRMKTLRILAHSSLGIAFFTALSGAFVAGLDAGLVYNSFPKMAGRWIPEDLLAFSPRITNFTENPTTVQFDHRLLGITTLSLIGTTWLMARSVAVSPRARLAASCLAAAGVTQVTLGITTLLYFVPIPVAASHQFGSLAVLSSALWLMHELRRKR
ncbi:heme A synthase COX15-like [Dysidea avara]|uniref:heme A synthase COX15-like n=1 Tax=Dysidea avara TaxID=196820 RepID=UPI003317AC8E